MEHLVKDLIEDLNYCGFFFKGVLDVGSDFITFYVTDTVGNPLDVLVRHENDLFVFYCNGNKIHEVFEFGVTN